MPPAGAQRQAATSKGAARQHCTLTACGPLLAKLAGQNAAAQQHYSQSPPGVLDEQPAYHRQLYVAERLVSSRGASGTISSSRYL